MESALRCAGQASTSYAQPSRRAVSGRRPVFPVVNALNSRDIITGYGWQGELPRPKNYQPGVIPGVRTVPTPILTPKRVLERITKSVPDTSSETYAAFYSNAFGGITTDPGLMFIPMDDHFVHKGHGVYETILLRDGYLYMLDRRLERLKQSAAKLNLPMPFSDTALKRIVMDTAAASRKMNGNVTVWITAGRGGFGTSTDECVEPGVYAMAIGQTYPRDRTNGFHASTLKVPFHNAPYGGIKSNQFLPHVMAQMAAQAEGSHIGLIADSEGYVQASTYETLVIINKDATLVHLPADNAIPSITLERMIELIPEERARSPDDILVQSIESRRIHYDELIAANEVFVVGHLMGTHGIVSVDGNRISDGLIGTTTLALHYTIDNDALPHKEELLKEGSPLHTAVPYGYAMGMRDQLV